VGTAGGGAEEAQVEEEAAEEPYQPPDSEEPVAVSTIAKALERAPGMTEEEAQLAVKATPLEVKSAVSERIGLGKWKEMTWVERLEAIINPAETQTSSMAAEPESLSLDAVNERAELHLVKEKAEFVEHITPLVTPLVTPLLSEGGGVGGGHALGLAQHSGSELAQQDTKWQGLLVGQSALPVAV
jgi:hypothetical protein